MNKQIIVALLTSAFVFTLAGCGGGPEDLVEKAIKLAKMDANDKEKKDIDDYWTKARKADAAKKIKEACKKEEISTMNEYQDCQIKAMQKRENVAEKCKDKDIKDLDQKCLEALDSIAKS